MFEIKYRDELDIKSSQNKWVEFIPENWDRTSLKRLVRTKITDGPHETPQFIDEGVPFMSAEAIVGSELSFDNKRGYISEKQHKVYRLKSKVQYHDILFCKSGSTTGKSALVKTVQEFGIWSPLAIIRSNKRIDSKLLFYNIQSRNFRIQVENFWSFGTQPNIGMGTLENLVVPYSKDCEEQQKIANFLDLKTAQFDNIIAKKEQLINKLEEAKKSLISEVVTGKVKIVDGQLVNRDASEMKDSGVAWLGMIPQDWITEKMKYIGNAIIGLTYSPDDVVDENGTLVLRSSNVQNGNITFDNNVFVNKKINPKLAVKEGDILICSRNGSRNLIGKNALILKEHEGATFGAFMTIFRTKYSRFIHLVLNSTLFDYQAGSYLTSTVNQLTISNLNNMVVPFPTLKDQNAIYEYLSNKLSVFTKSVDLNLKQIEKLNQAKQSLISEAVTGKIDLRDWEIIEEGELQ